MKRRASSERQVLESVERDEALVTTYSISRAWLWYQRLALTFSIGGGALMLAVAAGERGAAAVPLLSIGSVWLLIGGLGFRQYRGCAQQVSIDGNTVTFSGPRSPVVVSMADVVEVRRAWGDVNRVSPLIIVIANRAPIRIAPRMRGLFELFVDLRRVNPDVRLPDF